MLNKHLRKGQTYHRNMITVILPDGYKMRISNRAKKQKATISEIVRDAIKRFLGL